MSISTNIYLACCTCSCCTFPDTHEPATLLEPSAPRLYSHLCSLSQALHSNSNYSCRQRVKQVAHLMRTHLCSAMAQDMPLSPFVRALGVMLAYLHSLLPASSDHDLCTASSQAEVSPPHLSGWQPVRNCRASTQLCPRYFPHAAC